MNNIIKIEDRGTIENILNLNTKYNHSEHMLFFHFLESLLDEKEAFNVLTKLQDKNLSYILNNAIDVCLRSIQLALGISIETAPDFLYHYTRPNSFLILLNIKKLNIENPSLCNSSLITTEILNGIFEHKLNTHCYKHYIYFKDKQIVNNINYFTHIDKEHKLRNNHTKKYFNFLIDLFTYDHEPFLLNMINNNFNHIREIDPLLKNVKIKELENEIYNNHYSDDLVNTFKNLNNQNSNKAFINEIDNIFQISLDIEKISFIKNDKNYGKNFVANIYKFLNYAKGANIGFAESYITNKNELDKIKIKNKIYDNKEIATILKSFEFTYIDEQDKKNKKNILSDFFNAAVNVPMGYSEELILKEYEKIFNTVLFKYSLDNNLNSNNSTIKRANKI